MHYRRRRDRYGQREENAEHRKQQRPEAEPGEEGQHRRPEGRGADQEIGHRTPTSSLPLIPPCYDAEPAAECLDASYHVHAIHTSGEAPADARLARPRTVARRSPPLRRARAAVRIASI